MVNNGCGQSGDRTLKLTVLKDEQTEKSVFSMLVGIQEN